MKCPVCNVWTTVNETRNKEGYTLRRRECGNGHKFITEEHVKLQNLDARKPSSVRASGKRQDG